MMKKFLTVLCVVLMTLFAAACTQENNAFTAYLLTAPKKCMPKK